MKKRISVETTISVELTAQDLERYIRQESLIPKDWKYFSTNIIGKGVSQGAELVIKHLDCKPDEN